MTDFLVPSDAWLKTSGRRMLRLAKDPGALPRVEEDSKPIHRFDDPAQQYAIRYLAGNLVGCLLETVQRFRPPHAKYNLDAKLLGIAGIESGDTEPDRVQGFGDWLDEQHLGTLYCIESEVQLLRLAAAFDSLCHIPEVQSTITLHYPETAHLDVSHVLAGDSHGRAITQTISRAVYTMNERPGGIEYPSRRDLEVSCWAIFDRTSIEIEKLEKLSPENDEHRAALKLVCNRYGIEIPSGW